MCRHTKSLLTGVALLALVGAGAGAVSMIGAPSAPQYAAAAPVPAEEQAQTIAAMKPPKRARPVIAVIGHNDGTETTDYIIPYSVLAHSGVADVVALAPEARPIKLVPALAVQPQATTAAFDARYPDGADYVVVAAMHPRDDPTVVAWIKRQAANGAVIVGVCSGVRTLSAAGLLAGRRATRYWWDAEDLEGSNPTTRWVSDRRYVVDRGVVTTTGITASLPISLALVEAIAGRDRAADVAREFGVASWDARHNSEAFGFDRGMILAGITNKAAFWNSETRGLPVRQGVDELALAFTADAWSRTFRSNVVTVGNDRGPVETRRGLTLLPDRTASGEASVSMLPYPRSHEPAEALPEALAGIASRYGVDTAEFVAVQLEYPWQPK
jgi:putative intracellular protease/amidase